MLRLYPFWCDLKRNYNGPPDFDTDPLWFQQVAKTVSGSGGSSRIRCPSRERPKNAAAATLRGRVQGLFLVVSNPQIGVKLPNQRHQAPVWAATSMSNRPWRTDLTPKTKVEAIRRSRIAVTPNFFGQWDRMAKCDVSNSAR